MEGTIGRDNTADGGGPVATDVNEVWFGGVDAGPADIDNDDDEYDATIEAKGGFRGEDGPEADSFPREEGDPTDRTSSLALSTFSYFLF